MGIRVLSMENTYSTTIIDLKDKILSLAAEFPEVSRLATYRLLETQEGALQFALFCDYLGIYYAERIFDFLVDYQWRIFKDLLRVEKKALHKANFAQALLNVYQAFFAEAMAAKDIGEDPFTFLKDVPKARLVSYLNQEDPAKLALLAVFWRQSEVSSILEALESNLRTKVVLYISRLSRVPNEASKKSAATYANELSQKLIESVYKGPQPPVFKKKVADGSFKNGNDKVESTKVENDKVKDKIYKMLSEIDLSAEEKFFRVILPKSERMKEKWSRIRELHERSLRIINEAVGQRK